MADSDRTSNRTVSHSQDRSLNPPSDHTLYVPSNDSLDKSLDRASRRSSITEVPDRQRQSSVDAFHIPPTELEKGIRCEETTDTWDSDPDNPYNWPLRKRIYHVSVPSMLSFICTLGSSIYTVADADIVEYFGVSLEVTQLGLTLYVIGMSFGPVLAAPLSEHFGRRLVYLSTFLAAALFDLGAGFSQTFPALIVCRFFAGFFAGPVLAVGSGTIADCFQPEYRCVCITLYAGLVFFGPVSGPVMGGFAVEKLGWQWTQWILLFWCAFGCLYLIPFKETHKATILKAREKRAKTQTESAGEEPIRASSIVSKEAAQKGFDEIRKTLAVLLVRPLRMLCTEPILFSFSLYISFDFGIFYNFFGAFPLIFGPGGVYNFSTGIYGLVWLGLLVGTIASMIAICICDRKIYQPRLAKAIAEGNEGIAPENRIYPAMFGCFAIPICLFWFGWTARADIHWICPIIASSFFTLGNLSVLVSGMMYLTDTYGAQLGASALAANALCRYGIGALFPLFSKQMYTRLGIGWASSLLGFISLLLCVIPFTLFKYGPHLRRRSGR